MAYTNSDRKHVFIDSRCVLSGFMANLFEKGLKEALFRSDSVSHSIIEKDGGNLLRVETDGSIIDLISNVEEGVLSVEIMGNADSEHEKEIMNALGQYAGGSFRSDDGLHTRYNPLDVMYNQDRRQLFERELSEQNNPGIQLNKHEADEARRVVQAIGSAVFLDRGNPFHVDGATLPYIFSGTPSDLGMALEEAGFSVDVSAYQIKAMSGGDVSILSLNDVSGIKQESYAYLRMHPEEMLGRTVFSTTNSRLISKLNDAIRNGEDRNAFLLNVDDFVYESIIIRTDRLGLNSFRLEPVSIDALFSGDGDILFFDKDDFLLIMDNLQLDESDEVSGSALPRIMRELEFSYSNTRVNCVRDISSNRRFDTTEVTVDGKSVQIALDNRFTEEKVISGYIPVSLSKKSDTAFEASIVTTYLRDIGALTLDEVKERESRKEIAHTGTGCAPSR